MKKPILPVIALPVSLLALSLLASTVGAAVSKSPVNDTYMVIKITDENKTDNKIEFKVVTSTQYKDEEKRVKDDNAEKLKEWQDLIKTDPQTPRPSKILIVKVKTGYQTQKIAQEYADKLKAALTKDDTKKGGLRRSRRFLEKQRWGARGSSYYFLPCGLLTVHRRQEKQQAHSVCLLL